MVEKRTSAGMSTHPAFALAAQHVERPCISTSTLLSAEILRALCCLFPMCCVEAIRLVRSFTPKLRLHDV